MKGEGDAGAVKRQEPMMPPQREDYLMTVPHSAHHSLPAHAAAFGLGIQLREFEAFVCHCLAAQKMTL